eukprot:1145520-Pelagomonas_calceolata.AAC.2
MHAARLALRCLSFFLFLKAEKCNVSLQKAGGSKTCMKFTLEGVNMGTGQACMAGVCQKLLAGRAYRPGSYQLSTRLRPQPSQNLQAEGTKQRLRKWDKHGRRHEGTCTALAGTNGGSYREVSMQADAQANAEQAHRQAQKTLPASTQSIKRCDSSSQACSILMCMPGQRERRTLVRQHGTCQLCAVVHQAVDDNAHAFWRKLAPEEPQQTFKRLNGKTSRADRMQQNMCGQSSTWNRGKEFPSLHIQGIESCVPPSPTSCHVHIMLSAPLTFQILHVHALIEVVRKQPAQVADVEHRLEGAKASIVLIPSLHACT